MVESLNADAILIMAYAPSRIVVCVCFFEGHARYILCCHLCFCVEVEFISSLFLQVSPYRQNFNLPKLMSIINVKLFLMAQLIFCSPDQDDANIQQSQELCSSNWTIPVRSAVLDCRLWNHILRNFEDCFRRR